MVFSVNLANRFASDYKLPIPITFNEKYFHYYLEMLEEDYGAETKWNNLCSLINSEFDGLPEKFLEEYYNVRENIIQGISNNVAFQEFNNMDMSKYSITNPVNVTSNGIYNMENIGSAFLSIDLTKANFQALKYVNPAIVFNTNSYEEFIGNFTNLDYVKESKYTRNVVFGKCNPKRHITVEKYIINKIRELVNEILVDKYFTLVSMSTDELIYKFIDAEHIKNDEVMDMVSFLEREIRLELGFTVHLTAFVLDGYTLYNKDTNKDYKTIFNKDVYVTTRKDNKCNLMCVPLPFFPIVYKLFKNKKICEIDRHFTYEGMDAIINENFGLKKIK